MTDALERLKNQKRPQVKPRSDNLSTNDKKQKNTNISMNISTNESSFIDSNESSNSGTNEPSDLDTNESSLISSFVPNTLSTNKSSFTDTDELALVEVVRNSILLEKSLHNDLTEFCKQEKVIKAVWIEAAFRYLEEHPEVMKEVVSDALERAESRKQSARYRQAKSFSEKLPKRS